MLIGEIEFCNEVLNHQACSEEGIPPQSSQEIIAISAVSFQICKLPMFYLKAAILLSLFLPTGYEKRFVLLHYS